PPCTNVAPAPLRLFPPPQRVKVVKAQNTTFMRGDVFHRFAAAVPEIDAKLSSTFHRKTFRNRLL
ncbi:MAG: hypothetical protein RSB38_06225, partial [Oscillospiraceae bacterium]